MNKFTSPESERGVLGCILLKNSLLGTVDLEEGHFSDATHREIFRAINLLEKQKLSIDTVTVAESLQGGLRHEVIKIATEIPSTAGFDSYIKILKKTKQMREVSNSAQKIDKILTQSENFEESLSEVQSLFMNTAYTSGEPKLIEDILKDVLVGIFDTDRTKYEGIKTGFKDIDKRINGFKKGNLVILAARPGMGKTTLALNACWNIAKQKKRALFFSLEMSDEEVVRKIISSELKVNNEDLDSGAVFKKHDNVLSIQDIVAHKQFFIDQQGALSLAQISSKARKLSMEKPLDFIVVDYIQLINERASSRTEEIRKISGGLKALAKELNCPILALSQLNRSVEARVDKRPLLSDLRDSGSIEQDADICMFIYRPDYYEEDESRFTHHSEILIRKFRMGKPGTEYLLWDDKTSSFMDVESGWRPPVREEVRHSGQPQPFVVPKRNPFD
jgi:replicative DNA helicase